jgi:hypothetical protein
MNWKIAVAAYLSIYFLLLFCHVYRSVRTSQKIGRFAFVILFFFPVVLPIMIFVAVKRHRPRG